MVYFYSLHSLLVICIVLLYLWNLEVLICFYLNLRCIDLFLLKRKMILLTLNLYTYVKLDCVFVKFLFRSGGRSIFENNYYFGTLQTLCETTAASVTLWSLHWAIVPQTVKLCCSSNHLPYLRNYHIVVWRMYEQNGFQCLNLH